MKITKSELKRIIKEEVEDILAPSEMSKNVISNFGGAIGALRNGESFSYSAGGSLIDKLSSAAGPDGIVSNLNPKVVMGIGGAVVILILVAMALGYSVKVGGEGYGVSGEIVFEAPEQGQERQE